MRAIRVSGIGLAAVLCLADPLHPQDFDHLRVDGQRVETTHGLRIAFSAPPDLVPLGETHFRESYGGPSFDVSATAFTNDSVLLAAHAETHTDESGGLHYSDLPPDTLGGRILNSRIDCFDLREESAEDVEGNGFLRFLRGAGFDFQRAFVLKRFYLVNADGTSEVVLSYGLVVPACEGDEVPPAMATEVSRRSRLAFADLDID